MRRRRLVILFLLCALCSCQDEQKREREEESGSLYGLVSDAKTAEPIPNVLISIDGKDAIVTGSDGAYYIPSVKAGPCHIQALKEGYATSSSLVFIANGSSVKKDFSLPRIPAVVTTSTDEIDFGESEGDNTRSFRIVNNSYGTLHWEAINQAAWIEVSPSSGELPFTKTETIVVSIHRNLLAEGSNESVIVIRTSDGGSEVTIKAFVPVRKLPSVTIEPMGEVDDHSAVLNATLTDAGYPKYDELGFVVGLSARPTIDSGRKITITEALSTNTFSVLADGLDINTRYYARAYATNELGTSYSEQEFSFITTARAPVVSDVTLVNMDLSGRKATVQANLTDKGAPAAYERGFVYSYSNLNPTIDDDVLQDERMDAGLYSGLIVSLELDRRYYVRAYAKTRIGVTYSSHSCSFATTTEYPSVELLDAMDINPSSHSATLRGNVMDVGIPAYEEKGFLVVEAGVPIQYETATKVIVEGSGEGIFAASYSFPGQKQYNVKAYAKNAKGISISARTLVF